MKAGCQRFLRVLSCLGLAVGLATSADLATAQTSTNIVLVLVDDQRLDQSTVMTTLQSELVAKSTTFTNAFATTPLCCPSRASYLSGLYVFRHGVITNNAGMNLFDDTSTYATWLDAAGYRTGYMGKYFQAYARMSPYIPPGWDDFRATFPPNYFDYSVNDNGTIVPYGSSEADYSSDVITRYAVEFLEATQGEPFLLVVSYNAPHHPARAAPRHSGAFAGATVPQGPNYNEQDVSDKPVWVQDLPLMGQQQIDQANRGYAKQLEAMLAVDEGLASILTTLEQIDVLDDTAIIYTGDQGLSSGEHRWSGKQCPYDECLKIPLVVRLPGQTTPQVDESLVLNLDVAETIADLAGVPPPRASDGMSLLPLIDGTAVSWRQDFLAEYFNVANLGVDPVPTYTSVIDSSWKYITYDTGEEELYDRVDDPFELDNLAGDPAHADRLLQLAIRMNAIREGEPLGITTDALPDAEVGVGYSVALEAEGGVLPYTWTAAGGTLPDGLSLDADGLLGGVPGRAGSFEFPVTTIDEVGFTDTATLSLEVAAPSAGITATKTAEPTTLLEPGGDVTFHLMVDNVGAVAVTLESMVDDIHGDLAGRGDCAVPQPLDAGASYGCSFVATVSGDAGDQETDTITATAVDDAGEQVVASDSATVSIVSAGDTVTILVADWFQASSRLSVQATSSLGADVTLTAEGFGALNFFNGVHRKGFQNVPNNPGSLTVTSTGGGSATVEVNVR